MLIMHLPICFFWLVQRHLVKWDEVRLLMAASVSIPFIKMLHYFVEWWHAIFYSHSDRACVMRNKYDLETIGSWVWIGITGCKSISWIKAFKWVKDRSENYGDSHTVSSPLRHLQLLRVNSQLVEYTIRRGEYSVEDIIRAALGEVESIDHLLWCRPSVQQL
ncbi:uncharacterized protein LOC116253924 [Nymphaea colorata]|nr:uncharacterized protein LOC116253924 [Nymphaea colorata]